MGRITVVYCLFLLIFVKVSICLRVVGITVPALKQRGESATLTCDYDLEGGRLYSVKWYRDNEEFYRYLPKFRPPQHAHRLEGIRVDLERSTARRVHLRELTLKSRGLYRCEVSEEAPSFHSAQAEAFMEIYYFPKESPRISGHDRRYGLQDDIEVNCSSAKSFPAPDLQWIVDGQKVTDRSWLIAYGARPVAPGLLVSTLGLRAPAKPRMKLKCVASIGSHRRERTVVVENNSSYRRTPSFLRSRHKLRDPISNDSFGNFHHRNLNAESCYNNNIFCYNVETYYQDLNSSKLQHNNVEANNIKMVYRDLDAPDLQNNITDPNNLPIEYQDANSPKPQKSTQDDVSYLVENKRVFKYNNRRSKNS